MVFNLCRGPRGRGGSIQ